MEREVGEEGGGEGLKVAGEAVEVGEGADTEEGEEGERGRVWREGLRE